MNTALSWFFRIWLAFAIFVSVISIIGSFIGANSFSEGLSRIAEIYSPFNVINFITQVILFLPAIGAYLCLERRRKKDRSRHLVEATPSDAVSNPNFEKSTGEIDARVIEKYGVVLSKHRKHSLSTIRDLSELPYPKLVIRQALRDTFRRFPADKTKALKPAYIFLADFQELTAEEKNALAVTSDLADARAHLNAVREKLRRRTSSASCLDRVEAQAENERLELVQDLKSLGL